MSPITEQEARARGPKLRRELVDDDVQCYAGERVSGTAVRCGIEQHRIEASREASTLMNYCCGDYTQCPTWRAMKEAHWEGKRRMMDRELRAEPALDPR